MKKIVKQAVLVLLSISIGFVFLYSAYTKSNPIQGFEYTIVQYVHFPWSVASILARLLIGIEAGLGILILLNIYGKRKWILRSALFISILFSIYLLYLWTVFGNKVNCGCFGDTIWMNPSSSLLKNIILIFFLTIILKYNDGIVKKWTNWVSILILLIIIILPFITIGFPSDKPNWLRKDKFQLDFTAIYDKEKAVPVPTINLKQGKHILAFLSLSCPHCKMAARKMEIMRQRNPTIPFYFILAGKDKYISSFWKETNSEDIPHTKLDADSFIQLVGYTWPVIYFVNDGMVEANTSYVALEQDEIEKWLLK